MESPGYGFGQAPNNDNNKSHRPPRPPKYRLDRHARHTRRSNIIPVSAQRRRGQLSSPSSSSSASPVRERHRKRHYKNQRRIKHTSVPASKDNLEISPAWLRRLMPSSIGLSGFMRPLMNLGLLVPSSTQFVILAGTLVVVILCGLYFQIRSDICVMLQGTYNLVGGIQAPITALANSTFVTVGTLWCGSVGWGCIEARKATKTFKPTQFHELPTTPPAEEERVIQLANLDISLGHSFFDCLHDLGKIRSQKTAAAHLLTLVDEVYRWDGHLEHPDELYDNLKTLARLRKEILFDSNTARVVGRNSIKSLYTEWQNTGVLHKHKVPYQDLLDNINSVITSTSQELSSSAHHMTRTSDGLKSMEELRSKTAAQIHREIARLSKMNTEEKSVWGFKAKVFIRPGIEDVMKGRADAARFLKAVAKVVNSGVIVSLTNSLALQQCSINTKDLNQALERTFALINAKFALSARIHYISNGVNPLNNLLIEYDKSSKKKSSKEM